MEVHETAEATRALDYDRRRIRITKLDLHLAHACNLHCEQCTHFSNYGINHVLTYQDVESNYRAWCERIVPQKLALLGGEPLLNRSIIKILVLSRYIWPDTIIELWTNGLLLDRYPELPKVLEQHRIMLHISDHGSADTAEYNLRFDRMLDLVHEWTMRHPIMVTVRDFRLGKIHIFQPGSHDTRMLPIQPKFRFYQGYGADMLPYDHGDPKSSWDNCPVYHDCFQLLDHRIYKCAPLAYLPMLDQKFGLRPEWKPYLQYRPLEPHATDDEIREFFQRGAESYCAMCPSQRIPMYSQHNPLKFIPIRVAAPDTPPG